MPLGGVFLLSLLSSLMTLNDVAPFFDVQIESVLIVLRWIVEKMVSLVIHQQICQLLSKSWLLIVRSESIDQVTIEIHDENW